MGKDKKARKRKKNNGCNINSEEYNKQHEISNEDEERIEQRRSNRIGSIIGILAITITAIVVVFKVLIKVINVWPSEGFVYQYMHILMTMVLTSLLIVIGSAISFCIEDLQRYNITDIK